MAEAARMGMGDVVRHFEGLEDPRSNVNLRHPLESVVVIAVLGVLAGADGPTSIVEWAQTRKDLLLSALDLPHGIPKKDVFRRVLSGLQPQAFQSCFAAWINALRTQALAREGIEQLTFAIDGKSLRRSHNRRDGLGALHSVSVWASQLGLSLGEVACDGKSNEITAIPLVLQLVDIRGAIVTIDAMGTQTAIAAQIVDAKGDYVLALKGNQETTHDSVVDYINQQAESDFQNIGARRHETHEKGHGRLETRTVIQMPVPKDLPGVDRWRGLNTIAVVMLSCIRDGKETVETRYYLSSLEMGVRRIADAIRSHWAIENTLHWCLDVTYREDESRIREKNLRSNFAWLRRFTLSLLKQHPGKTSIAMKRRKCGWSDEFLFEVINAVKT